MFNQDDKGIEWRQKNQTSCNIDTAVHLEAFVMKDKIAFHYTHAQQ